MCIDDRWGFKVVYTRTELVGKCMEIMLAGLKQQGAFAVGDKFRV